MYLTVKEKDSGAVIFKDELEVPSWSYDLHAGGYTFSFSGNHFDRKIFSKFQNVADYRKALLSLIGFFSFEISRIQNHLNNNASIINHNFIETCKHMRDPLSQILPNFSGTKNHTEKIQRVVNSLNKSEPVDTARALLEVDRAITNLQTQISGLDIVSGDYTPTFIEHPPHALIDNIIAPFDKSLEEKSIRIFNNIHDQPNLGNGVLLDYELFNWAFYHLINNAVKYCRPGSDIKIWYEGEKRTFYLKMFSLKVEDSEADRIFEFGVRGEHAIEQYSGEGMGMTFARLSLRKMGAQIQFIPRNETCRLLDGKLYCENEVEIRLG